MHFKWLISLLTIIAVGIFVRLSFLVDDSAVLPYLEQAGSFSLELMYRFFADSFLANSVCPRAKSVKWIIYVARNFWTPLVRYRIFQTLRNTYKYIRIQYTLSIKSYLIMLVVFIYRFHLLFHRHLALYFV